MQNKYYKGASLYSKYKTMSESSEISPIDQYVIDEVKRRRIARNISQRNLAYMLDVSVGFIGNIENPRYRAKYNITLLNEIAKILECSPKDFFPKDPL